jgi:hypothetical protein
MTGKVGATALDGKPCACQRGAMLRSGLVALVLLSACSSPSADRAGDNASDPAIADAVAGPLMSDGQMGGAASPDALRPGEQPATLPVPIDARIDTAGAPTLGQVVAATLRDPAFAGCSAEIGYSAMWSVKLPAPLALPKDARLAEAAGRDGAGCALRIVRFAQPGAPAATIAAYEALAKREGFAVVAGKAALTAMRARDGIAFQVEAALSTDGTRVDLVTRSR